MFYISPDTAMGAGVTIIFYGLYYGVLGRDCAEICTDKMAAKMGVCVLRFSRFRMNDIRFLVN